MPATEQTCRNIKLLHKVFAVSGVLLLITTLWMLWADYADPWKPYQRQRTSIDLKTNQWDQLQFSTEEAMRRHAELAESVAMAKLEVPNLDAFKAEVKQHGEFDFSSIDTALNKLSAAVAEVTRTETDGKKPGLLPIVKSKTDAVAKLEADALKADAAAKDAAAKIAAAADRAAALELSKQLAAKAVEVQKSIGVAREELRQAETKLNAQYGVVAQERSQLMDRLQTVVRSARFKEDTLLGQRKFRNANLDAARAALNILIRDHKPAELQEAAQKEVDKIVLEIEGSADGKVEGLTQKYQKTNAHRVRLQNIISALNSKVDGESKKQSEALAKLKQLQKTYDSIEPTWFTTSYPLLGKKWLNLPIIDAFGGPEKPKQIWLPEITYDFNFRKVARFDRCITCHQSLDRSGDTPHEPLYAKERRLELTLLAPASETLPANANGKRGISNASLESLFGIRIAESGLVSSREAAISLVVPQSPAARAEFTGISAGISGERSGFQVGDVIETINGGRVDHPGEVSRLLMRDEIVGKSVTVLVRRGLPNPYTSHPRLDLYVSDSSPHAMGKFGCTICHEGQDSGTAFQWTSHTPNDLEQRDKWAQKHGWFDNHHWIFPMYPERFNQSGCLKCHHQVVELRPSERFPEAPAEKLVHGYDLIRKFGCFGCHEITGKEGEKRLGPDMRLEPNFFAAAQQVQADPNFAKLSPELRRDVETVIASPDRNDARRRLFAFLTADSTAQEARLTSASHRMAPVLKDVDLPGDIRKAGPSLRYVKQKLDPLFLVDWIRTPKNFRPETRMPQFFGLTKHLQENNKKLNEVNAYESVEILGIAEYLQSSSQSFEPVAPPKGIAESAPAEKVARGKMLFETRGCLACHNHAEFPAAAKMRDAHEIVQGPDLSGVGAKFNPKTNPSGRSWLYSWIREPSRYHARTVMPDLFLSPIKQADGKLTDPAEDIVEFLLSGASSWTPAAEAKTVLDASSSESLRKLSLEHLKKSFHESRATRYLKEGIPLTEAADVRGAELQLVGAMKSEDADHKLLMYIGQKAVSKYGCYACHDIPGFEDAKPIGTNLNNWGRKDPSRLAFEHIGHYAFGKGHGHGHATDAGKEADHNHPKDHGHAKANDAQGGAASAKASSAEAHAKDDATGASHETKHAKLEEHEEHVNEHDLGFYRQALEAGNRTGFIYQKLTEPRSFDYRVAENKPFNDLLRMPQFPLTHNDREAIITFVLGLVADPPSSKFVYQPAAAKQAIVEGRKVLDKYNCAGCHMLEVDKWQVTYQPGAFKEERKAGDATAADSAIHPFLKSEWTAAEKNGLIQPDKRRGEVRTTVYGMQMLDDDGFPAVFDAEGIIPREDLESVPLADRVYKLELYRPAVIGSSVKETFQETAPGQSEPKDAVRELYEPKIFYPGVENLSLPHALVKKHIPSEGGFLAKYLAPVAFSLEKKANAGAVAGQVWAWLPPPLMGEGSKVQTGWLHDFLLDPHPIRPAVFLRMPKFNMSSEEATILARYFAAVSHTEYPYEFVDQIRPSQLDKADEEYRKNLAAISKSEAVPPPAGVPAGSRFDDAMRVVVSQTYCVKCHIVGDFNPQSSDRAKAPDLSTVRKRLRHEYVRRWIANPKMILPYTAMPIQFQYDPSDKKNFGGLLEKGLYHGTSMEQVDGVTDLLMGFDQYSIGRGKVNELVEKVKAAAPADPKQDKKDAKPNGTAPATGEVNSPKTKGAN